jgi:hypothetical protein
MLSALLLAACGGDDGPSREDFVAEADALCERLNERIEEVNEREPQNLEELRGVLDDGLEITEEGLDQFRELEVPDEVEEDVDRYLDAAEEQKEILERARAADSPQAVGEILEEQLPAVQEEREEAADDVGFEKCGQG